MKRLYLKVFLLGTLLFIVMPVFNDQGLFAQEFELRIIKSGAVLRLHPEHDSQIIMDLPLGAALQYEALIEGWFKIRMSSKELGKTVIGYVHSSFVEILKQPAPTIIEKKPETSLETKEGYYDWKRELARAQSLQKSGIPLLVVGTALLAPSLYFALRGPGEGHYYYTWAKIAIGVGIFGGATFIIFGISNMSRGSSLIRQLEDEGIRRGYISIGLLPNFRAVGIQVQITY